MTYPIIGAPPNTNISSTNSIPVPNIINSNNDTFLLKTPSDPLHPLELQTGSEFERKRNMSIEASTKSVDFNHNSTHSNTQPSSHDHTLIETDTVKKAETQSSSSSYSPSSLPVCATATTSIPIPPTTIPPTTTTTSRAITTTMSPPSLSSSSSSSLNVLVVDDCHMTRSMMQRMLHQLGHKTWVAEDGKEACDIIMNRNGVKGGFGFGDSYLDTSDTTNHSFQSLSHSNSISIHHHHHPSLEEESIEMKQLKSMKDDQSGSHIEENKNGQRSSESVFNSSEKLPPFDVVLMDNQMPKMTGVTATLFVRSHGIVVPIIGVTGNALVKYQIH